MTSIDMEKAQLTSVPKWVPECTSLKTLDLDRNKIKIVRPE